MLKRTIRIAFVYIIFLTNTNSMIMRNNALMSKMVSQFQGKENSDNTSIEPKRDAPRTNVISMMQNVLCHNFPSIPCELITTDKTLRTLIEKSVQQIRFKKLTMEKKTQPVRGQQLTLFPVINSEDLSSLLQVSDGVFYTKKKTSDKPRSKVKKSATAKNFWSHEAQHKKKESKKPTFTGRKKIRKFYPHKIKYKDKNVKPEIADYSDEKLSMSVEAPESNAPVQKRHFSYRTEPSDLAAVWRIDYMKHGEPSLNMFDYGTDILKGKMVKTGPNVIVDDNIVEHAVRRDVLHPDVYIKNKYVRKSAADSDSID